MKRVALSLCMAILFASPAIAGQTDSLNDMLVKALPWRSLGPAVMGGRVDDFAVVESDPSTFYVGTASGGVFKTVNHGTTFQSVFDAQPCLSIGDVTVAPSRPSTVWVGTGEANNRQSSSWGNGVYKSTDSGVTWSYMGLPESRHIGRIVIDPKNPDVVYVAAGGDLWSATPERGVYKTNDGGVSWTHSLAIDADTGCTDLALDPSDPQIIYAAAYQRRRTAAGFNGGGPGSAIYKTSDGGAHWKRLNQGLPTGDNGRIGLDIYRKNPSIVYACVENAAGGIFRSEDKGETWKKMGTVSMGLNAFRPMYFSQIRVDPNNDQNLMMGGVNLGYSGDGGATFATTFPGADPRIHPDVHAIWIDPANSRHILVGCDGGLQWTFDQGATWDHNNNIAISQFYEVAYDMRKPYWVYGGLQDNGSWGAPSMSLTGQGLLNSDWINVGGGDGFYCQADPIDANTVYSESQQGAVARLNVVTGERKSIRPFQAPGDSPYRFDWNTPILISPHNHNRIYLGGNRLFISDDRGDSWRSTADLSTNPDRAKMPIMGVVPSPKTLSLNDGQDTFGEIVTLSESPAQSGVLWIGTDDGNVQVSRDDGRTWKNVADRVPGVPRGTYVTRVLASAFVSGRAYVALDGHRAGDFKPHLLVTEDFGETWRPIETGIPEHHTLKAIREHPRNPSLLFAGTERGAFVSLNRGSSWTRLGTPLPAVPVNDIQVHVRENDLILATHGRGIWILDDITAFEELADRSLTTSYLLCNPRPAVQYRTGGGQSWGGNRVFVGANPAPGAVIQYCVPAQLPATASGKLQIFDRGGKQVVSEFKNLNLDAGLHRLRWNMRYTGPSATDAQVLEEQNSGAAPAQNDERDEESHKDGDRDVLSVLTRHLFANCAATDSRVYARQSDGYATSKILAVAFAGAQTPAEAPIPQDPQQPLNGVTPGGRARRQGGAGAGGAQGGRGGGQGRGGGGRGLNFGPRVLPGTYLVRMTVGTEVQTREIKVEDDSRVRIADRDRHSLYELQIRVFKLSQAYGESRRSLAALRTQLATLLKSPEIEKAPSAVKQSVTDLDNEAASAQQFSADGQKAATKPAEKPAETGQATESGQTAQGQAQAGVLQQRINRLIGSLNGITEPVSKYQRQESEALADIVRQVVDSVNALNSNNVVRVNKTLSANKLNALPQTPVIPRVR